MFSVMNTVFLKTDGAGVAAPISVNAFNHCRLLRTFLAHSSGPPGPVFV